MEGTQQLLNGERGENNRGYRHEAEADSRLHDPVAATKEPFVILSEDPVIIEQLHSSNTGVDKDGKLHLSCPSLYGTKSEDAAGDETEVSVS